MKITIAFYKGEGDILNKIVRWWTKSQYSHAELILNDRETWISISPKFLSKIEASKKQTDRDDRINRFGSRKARGSQKKTHSTIIEGEAEVIDDEDKK